MTMREKIARAIHNAAPCSDDPETNAVLFDEMRELRLKEADAVLALIEQVMEENERRGQALERITWLCPSINVANSKHNQMVQKKIEQIARAALSPKSEKRDG